MKTSALVPLLAAFGMSSCLQLPPLGGNPCHPSTCEHHGVQSVPVAPGPASATVPERAAPMDSAKGMTPTDSTTSATQPEPDPWARADSPPAVLWARDGSPVDDGRGPVEDAHAMPEPTTTPGPSAPNARDVKSEDGRLYLLELYQSAVDERDDLILEVGRQEEIILDLRSLHATLETEFSEMQARLQTLEQEKMAAEEQSFELANRLTTAQIGRLQAELQELRQQALAEGLEAAVINGVAPSGNGDANTASEGSEAGR